MIVVLQPVCSSKTADVESSSGLHVCLYVQKSFHNNISGVAIFSYKTPRASKLYLGTITCTFLLIMWGAGMEQGADKNFILRICSKIVLNIQ